MFFQWTELRLLNPVYILCHFALRCFYILWLNLPLMPLLTHHETRDECKGGLISFYYQWLLFLSYLHYGSCPPIFFPHSLLLTRLFYCFYHHEPNTYYTWKFLTCFCTCTAGAASHMQDMSLCKTSLILFPCVGHHEDHTCCGGLNCNCLPSPDV